MLLILLTIISILSFYGYIYTNRRPFKYAFAIKFDKYIKVQPVFLIPYVTLYPLLITAYLLLGTSIYFVDFLMAIILVNLSATVFWYLVPNGVKRQQLAGKNFLEKGLNFFYIHDGDTNGFPSAHVFLSLVCCYYLALAIPRLLAVWVLVGLAISISTIFTKQHFVLDIFGGIVFACLAIVGSGLLSF